MGEFPRGQRGQTVNLLALPSVVRIHLLPPKNSTSFSLSNFFIHCESNGISSRPSVYLITEGAYHQWQAVSDFAMMIYNGKPLVIYKAYALIIYTALP